MVYCVRGAFMDIVGRLWNIPHCGVFMEYTTLWGVYGIYHIVGRLWNIPHCGAFMEYTTLWGIYGHCAVQTVAFVTCYTEKAKHLSR